MQSMPISQAREQLGPIGTKVQQKKRRMVVTKRGQKLFAMVPIEDLEMLEAIEDRIDLEDARKALRDVSKHGAKSWKRLKAELNL